MSGIYVASRVSRAPMWQELRDSGVEISSSWIDEAEDSDTVDLSELWKRIEREIRISKGLIFYGDVSDAPWKGAMIEVGMALALHKPVAIVIVGHLDSARSCRPIGSWIHHPRVSLFGSIGEAVNHINRT